MKSSLIRLYNTYKNDGLLSTASQSIRYGCRYSLHWLGKAGLYSTPRYQTLLQRLNGGPFSKYVDPFTIIFIDPSEIKYITTRGPNQGRFKWQDIGSVEGGSWDQSEDRFGDLPVAKALRDRFEGGKAWEEIDFIQDVIRLADRGIVRWRGCRTEADVMDACAEIDALYEQIKIDGYRSKKELVEAGACSPDIWDVDGFNQYDEVLVDIGRDGQFLFVDGRHRLTIAKILEIDKIPVRVSARHAAWQELREEIAETEPSALPEHLKQYLEHPDISAS